MTKNNLDKYMRGLLFSDRELLIHTHRLSWIDDETINKLSNFSSEKKRQIKFVISEENETGDRLRRLGIGVWVPPSGFPKLSTRFTIVDPDRADCRALVALRVYDDKRVELYEFQKGPNPLWDLADDLRKVISAVERKALS